MRRNPTIENSLDDAALVTIQNASVYYNGGCSIRGLIRDVLRRRIGKSIK